MACVWLRRAVVRNAAIAALCTAMGNGTHARSVTINVPGGSVVVDISHVGPAGDLVTPGAPVTPGFGPPSIFSVPLPSGSGARALGVAGAFTAEADDATAASWNPGGLTQLERPEASVVVRAGAEKDVHRSGDETFRVGSDAFEDIALNYFSVVWPFRLAGRNGVISLNYQEVYDFTQEFTADLRDASREMFDTASARTFTEDKVEHYDNGTVNVVIKSHLETATASTLHQILTSETVTDVRFRQSGRIDAISPALAVEVTPRFSIGVAVNFYRNDHIRGDPIRSETRAAYSGSSRSVADIVTRRTTEGTYDYAGTVYFPPGGTLPIGVTVPVSGSGAYAPFMDTEGRRTTGDLVYDGLYEETSTYDNLSGENVTMGVLCTVNRFLGFGFTVDTGWQAKGTQQRIVRHSVTTYDSGRTRVLDSTSMRMVDTRSAEFNFPLYWSAGLVWRWTPELHTMVDVSQTLWSDFWYRSGGDGKMNPLDGTLFGVHPLDDCWSIRTGAEYLWVTKDHMVPFRGGAGWEQRPAVGSPDEYWSVSLGSGISLGREPGACIIDLAYTFTWGSDVLGSLVPGQDMTSDVEKHQGYVSAIWHF